MDPSGLSWLSGIFKALFAIFAQAFTGINYDGRATPPTFPTGTNDVWQKLQDAIIPPMNGGIIDEKGGFGNSLLDKSSTDCQQFSRITDMLAQKAKTVGEFMDLMASTFTGAKNSSISEMQRTQNRAAPTHFGDSGFKPEFQDHSNQVRHFVGGLVAGYDLGDDLGLYIMNQREEENPGPNGIPNQADIALNAVSTRMGEVLRPYPRAPKLPFPAKPFTYRDLGAQIRAHVCE